VRGRCIQNGKKEKEKEWIERERRRDRQIHKKQEEIKGRIARERMNCKEGYRKNEAISTSRDTRKEQER
jgi:hypothetical protein